MDEQSVGRVEDRVDCNILAQALAEFLTKSEPFV